jgi:hypothetical protein
MPLFGIRSLLNDLLTGNFLPKYEHWYHDSGLNQDDCSNEDATQSGETASTALQKCEPD